MPRFWTIKEHIGTFERSGLYTKELNLVSFADKPAVLDIRAWTEDEAGEKVCCKGLTLTEDGARKLLELLQAYLGQDEEEDPAPAADPDEKEAINAEMSEELERLYAS